MAFVETPRRRTTPFGELVIEYDERVLQPREWTTIQSAWAAELLTKAPEGRFLELCAGAGHIGLLAAKMSGREWVTVDLSEVACDFTRHNAAAAGFTDSVEVRRASIERSLGLDETFPVIIADPPWVKSGEIGGFPEDPELAIDGGADGLVLARNCVEIAADHLDRAGSLLLQLGDDTQCDRILDDAHRNGLRDGGRRTGARGVILRVVRPG